MIDEGNKPRSGITAVELLVVIAIIGVAFAILLPAIQRAREAANSVVCKSNLRQIALAVHGFQDANRRIPYNQYGRPQFGIGRDSHAWSWLARLLPHLERDDLYRVGDIPNATLVHSGIISKPIDIFLCPSDPDSAQARMNAGNLRGIAVGNTNYKGVSGANWGDGSKGPFRTDWRNIGTNGSFNGHDAGDGMFYRRDYRRPLRVENIRDGTSNTFMIGEDVPELDWWCSWPYANNANGTCAIPPNVVRKNGAYYRPWNWQNCESFRSRHTGGLHFAFADTSVRFIDDGISLSTYRSLATINGNEQVNIPD